MRLAAAILVLGLGACEVDDGVLGARQQGSLVVDGDTLGGIGVDTDVVAGDWVPSGPAPASMTVHQGMGINGMGINGMGINGMGINGMGINGMTLAGVGLANARVDKGGLVAERFIDTVKGKKKQTLRGESLEGVELTGFAHDRHGFRHEVKYRIAEVMDVVAVMSLPEPGRSGEWNPLHAYGDDAPGTSFVYRVEMLDTRGFVPAWVDACPAATNEPAVATWAFPVQGVWNATTGARQNHAGAFTFACMSGAIGKCYKWGYRPWVSLDMRDMHQACTRMARADYCGDGKSHTADGTEIDIADLNLSPHVHVSAEPPGFVGEALWKPDGAQCVFAERLDGTDVTMADVEAMCGSSMRSCDYAKVNMTAKMLRTRVAHATPFHHVPLFDPSTSVLSQ